MRIISSMYQQHGAAVLSYLPPNDAAARKNFVYKTLFDGFAKLDGKLVETPVRAHSVSDHVFSDVYHGKIGLYYMGSNFLLPKPILHPPFE